MRGLGGADALMASTTKGGMFSLLLSPSSTVMDDLKRFVVGVLSGVGGSLADAAEWSISEGDGGGGVDSATACLFPSTELRVCILRGL